MKETESDLIYRRLKGKITSGKLGPGERIVVAQVSREMGVSAMPVRSALKQLQQDGLVEVTPYAGAQVAKLEAKQFKEIAVVRQLLEPYAAKLAVDILKETDYAQLEEILANTELCAKNFDPIGYSDGNNAFHAYIYKHCGNRTLEDVIFQMWNLSRITRSVYALRANRIEISLKEHREILRLIKEKRADEVYTLMLKNNIGGFESVIRDIERLEK